MDRPEIILAPGPTPIPPEVLLAQAGPLVYHRGPAFGSMLRELAERPVKAVLLTQSETSTGVVHDIEPIARAAKDAGALVIVDAVSSLGAVPFDMDAWGIDVAVSGSQK